MESPWQLCPEFDLKMRQVTYTLTLNHSMAKTAQTTETQVHTHIYTLKMQFKDLILLLTSSFL